MTLKRKRKKEPEDGGAEPDERLRAEDADSARIIARVQEGDSEAFGRLYTRYLDRVFAYFRMVLRSREDAEDAAQHVFTQAFAAVGSYELRKQPFRAWLFTIARNHAISELRKEDPLLMEPEEIDRRREREGPHEPALDPTSWLSNQDFLFLIERLPLPQRQVLVLRFMLDLPGPEIGRILDRRPGAIRALQHRAFDTLKDRLIALGRAPSNPDPDRDRDRDNNMRRWPKRAPVLRARRFSL